MTKQQPKTDQPQGIPVVAIGDQPQQAVAVAGPSPALLDRMLADAGKGVSTDQSDNLVPLIYVLQTNSPQVNERGPDYIQGAKPGDIWLRNSPVQIVRGQDGIVFQPCAFQKDWVEWIPRSAGGGYVGRHPERPSDAKETPDPKNVEKMLWMRPNGHEVKETRYHIGYAMLPDGRAFPYVIPLSGTGHSVSRAWMFQMNTKQLQGKGLPSWACLYRLKTKPRSNAAGDWFAFDISDEGWVQSMEDYQRGADLYNAFASGAKVAAAPEQEQSTTGASDDGAM